MRLEEGLIAVAVFGFIILAGYSLFAANLIAYSDSATSTLFDDFVNVSNISVQRSEALEELTDGNIKDEDTESSIYKSNIPTIKSIKTPKADISDIFQAIIKNTGNLVPDWVYGTMLAVVGILFATFIMYMIARFKPQN